MSANGVDVLGLVSQAQSVNAPYSMFNNVRGQQINNYYNKDTEKERRELADWLTPLNFRQTQSNIYGNRREGTGDWVLDNEVFKEWQTGCAKTMWCPGIPGTGKTVLASYIINFLTEKYNTPDVAVAYIYCNYKEQSTQTVYDLVASLLKQLVQDHSSTFTRVASQYQSYRQQGYRPTIQQVHNTLMSEIKQFQQVFVVVDALDEITESDNKRYDLLNKLRSLGCSLLVTSREMDSIRKALRNVPYMHIRAHDDDIRRYIEGRILPGTLLYELINGDPPLREEIIECIIKRAGGM
ncbi:hypothetical protein SERLA73DRAFT_149665 [Serpula lacrymans var. lacrymans S7.3]|uniref:Nephrocystin 3-like N-terminal domain-containing protein n=1 Tax=Serpula lacrymans var. lacrymans (strain S7.3) TaxID=936435 RepID=F8PKH6_SERL3|nr:hypothetical protein SERLA73DRAFT_149665 [Serpula lacrymans var. lacrymans S7.3]